MFVVVIEAMLEKDEQEMYFSLSSFSGKGLFILFPNSFLNGASKDTGMVTCLSSPSFGRETDHKRTAFPVCILIVFGLCSVFSNSHGAADICESYFQPSQM